MRKYVYTRKLLIFHVSIANIYIYIVIHLIQSRHV